MKHVKKLASLLLAIVMVFSMTTTVLAATVNLPGDNTILKGHSFVAYQVFSGDEANGVLSNVVWGSGINEAEFLDVLKTDEAYSTFFTGCAAAADVAKVLSDNKTNEAMAKAVAQIAYDKKKGNGTALSSGENNLADGYYLIVDTTTNMEEGGAYNAALLQVVGNVNVQVKTDVPEVEKKVKDTNDSIANSTTDWQDSADYDIGDDVPFQLKATLPNNVSSYDKYKLEFHDTLSAGLDYDVNSAVTVKIDNTKIDSSKYSVTSTVNEDGTTSLTISFTNVKDAGATDSSVVTVEYTAKLDTDAVIGSAGNPNEVYLTYSNNPNDGGEGTNDTPEDIVIVFTYKTIVNKIAKNPNYVADSTDPETKDEYIPLTGAEFTLEKQQPDKTWKSITVAKNEAGTEFTFSGLDDGQYRLVESTTPDGYNTISPIYFVIEATHDGDKDTPALTKLNAYVTDENWNKKTNETGTNIDLGVVTPQSGSIETDVENLSGSTLPETGGIGTTIFYVLGGILVVAAAILLVTKKRMSAEK